MFSKKTLAALVPLFIVSNALLFEPVCVIEYPRVKSDTAVQPSASVAKRHGALRRAGHGRRQSGDGWVSAGCYT